jgi:hypothetical protein
MSDMFACPHCGASYPRKPVLVGKVVRCTKCRNPFKLRPDGIADAVVESGPVDTKPEAKPAEAAKPAPAAPPLKTGNQTIAVTPSVKPATARVGKPGAPAGAAAAAAAPTVKPAAPEPAPTPAAKPAAPAPAAKPAAPAGKPPGGTAATSERLSAAPGPAATRSGGTSATSERLTKAAPSAPAANPPTSERLTKAGPKPEATGEAKPSTDRVAKPDADGTGSNTSGPLTARATRKDLNAQQEEARRAMSASLASAMGKLQTEAAPIAYDDDRIDPLAPLTAAAAAKTKGGSQRLTRTKPGTESQRRAAPVAVLSGEGERQGRQQRTLLFACAGILVLALVVWGLLQHEGPLDYALTRYSAPVQGAVFPERHRAIQARCLLWAKVPGGQQSDPFEGLHDRQFGAPHTIERSAIAEALAQIAGMTLVSHQQVWVDQARAQDAATVLSTLPSHAPEDITAALAKANIKAVLEQAFVAKLAAAGLDDEAQGLFVAMLAGETEHGVNALAAHLLSGDVPQRIEWLSFHGDHGDFLSYDGFHYQYKDRKYRGHLVRFAGAGPDWPTEQNVWKVFDVSVAGP